MRAAIVLSVAAGILLSAVTLAKSVAVTDREDVKKAVASKKYTEIVLKEGNSKEADKAAKAGQTVNVHYTGWLVDGKKFDSSKDRGTPFSFKLGAGRVIKGWDKGVEGMKPGESKILVLPPEYAYGPRAVGNGLIPANSTLVFQVDYISAK